MGAQQGWKEAPDPGKTVSAQGVICWGDGGWSCQQGRGHLSTQGLDGEQESQPTSRQAKAEVGEGASLAGLATPCSRSTALPFLGIPTSKRPIQNLEVAAFCGETFPDRGATEAGASALLPRDLWSVVPKHSHQAHESSSCLVLPHRQPPRPSAAALFLYAPHSRVPSPSFVSLLPSQGLPAAVVRKTGSCSAWKGLGRNLGCGGKRTGSERGSGRVSQTASSSLTSPGWARP